MSEPSGAWGEAVRGLRLRARLLYLPQGAHRARPLHPSMDERCYGVFYVRGAWGVRLRGVARGGGRRGRVSGRKGVRVGVQVNFGGGTAALQLDVDLVEVGGAPAGLSDEAQALRRAFLDEFASRPPAVDLVYQGGDRKPTRTHALASDTTSATWVPGASVRTTASPSESVAGGLWRVVLRPDRLTDEGLCHCRVRAGGVAAGAASASAGPRHAASAAPAPVLELVSAGFATRTKPSEWVLLAGLLPHEATPAFVRAVMGAAALADKAGPAWAAGAVGPGGQAVRRRRVGAPLPAPGTGAAAVAAPVVMGDDDVAWATDAEVIPSAVRHDVVFVRLQNRTQANCVVRGARAVCTHYEMLGVQPEDPADACLGHVRLSFLPSLNKARTAGFLHSLPLPPADDELACPAFLQTEPAMNAILPIPALPRLAAASSAASSGAGVGAGGAVAGATAVPIVGTRGHHQHLHQIQQQHHLQEQYEAAMAAAAAVASAAPTHILHHHLGPAATSSPGLRGRAVPPPADAYGSNTESPTTIDAEQAVQYVQHVHQLGGRLAGRKRPRASRVRHPDYTYGDDDEYAEDDRRAVSQQLRQQQQQQQQQQHQHHQQRQQHQQHQHHHHSHEMDAVGGGIVPRGSTVRVGAQGQALRTSKRARAPAHTAVGGGVAVGGGLRGRGTVGRGGLSEGADDDGGVYHGHEDAADGVGLPLMHDGRGEEETAVVLPVMIAEGARGPVLWTGRQASKLPSVFAEAIFAGEGWEEVDEEDEDENNDNDNDDRDRDHDLLDEGRGRRPLPRGDGMDEAASADGDADARRHSHSRRQGSSKEGAKGEGAGSAAGGAGGTGASGTIGAIGGIGRTGASAATAAAEEGRRSDAGREEAVGVGMGVGVGGFSQRRIQRDYSEGLEDGARALAAATSDPHMDAATILRSASDAGGVPGGHSLKEQRLGTVSLLAPQSSVGSTAVGDVYRDVAAAVLETHHRTGGLIAPLDTTTPTPAAATDGAAAVAAAMQSGSGAPEGGEERPLTEPVPPAGESALLRARRIDSLASMGSIRDFTSPGGLKSPLAPPPRIFTPSAVDSGTIPFANHEKQ